MKPSEALEIIISVTNRAPISPAEKLGLQTACRFLSQSFAQQEALQKRVKELQESAKKLTSEPTAEPSNPSSENIQIKATEEAEIPPVSPYEPSE